MNPVAASAGPVLRDIHAAPAPGWWPPAPGWWIVALAVIAVGTIAWIHLARHWRRSRRRRAILREFERCVDGARDDPSALAATLSAFLRRLARRTQPDSATLVGEHWLAHLDRCSASEEFTRGVGRALIEAPYRPAAAYDRAALIALARRCARRAVEGSGVDA